MNSMYPWSAVYAGFSRISIRWLPALVLLCLALPGRTYPPAPHHLLYGMVRDEYGSPIQAAGAQIILVTAGGRELKTKILTTDPGVNYSLEVPMDAGLTSDLYKPTAMQPTMPFQIKVVINKVVYLPIELKGKSAQIGEPGRRTRLDLTLGEDSDGDGLPDAWERMINRDIRKVNPQEDPDQDGMTNLQEYLAGTYALDASDGLALVIRGLHNGEPVMKFTAIRGRTYTLLGSTDFATWTPVSFRIPVEGANAAVRLSFQATQLTPIEVEAVTGGMASTPTFFKLLVQ